MPMSFMSTKVIIRTDDVDGFFARAKDAARRADHGQPFNGKITLTFEDPQRMFTVLSETGWTVEVVDKHGNSHGMALRDVQRLVGFLAGQSPDAAKRAVKAIREGVLVLGLQASTGRPIEEMPNDYREWLIDCGDSGYVARYRLDLGVVVILAVPRKKEVGY